MTELNQVDNVNVNQQLVS